MHKGLKIGLIILGSIVGLVLIVGGIGWWYLQSTFLTFEKDYPERRDFQALTVEGYTFLDRNQNGRLDPYEDGRRPRRERVADLLAQMTQEEKIHLLKGSGIASAMGMVDPGEGIPGAVGTIVPTPRLGIPTVYLSDGPAGLRIQPTREGEDRTYYCTAFPIGTLLASTWNVDLVREVGSAMGKEALEYGIDVILGPGANIHRHPLCGRNFEYYSEDPVLSGYIGAAMVNGLESNGVGASVKHYVANNQETDRNLNDARVSERALREIYLKGFEIIVRESQPWTIMSSYNKVNGTYVSESRKLLTDILRKEWGFQGLVMSDWFGGRDPVAMVRAGNDLLEPGTNKQWKALRRAAEDGILSPAVIDTAAGRILNLVLGSRKMEPYTYGNDPDLEAHAAITRRSAAEGMVLLKNEGTLPLPAGRQVALLGVTSYAFIAGGTGSGDVNEAYTVSLEEGLEQAGFSIYGPARDSFEAHRAANAEAFVQPEGLEAMIDPFDPPEMAYSPDFLEQCAQDADLAIVTIGRNSGEGGDRREVDDFRLTELEETLISHTCRAFHALGKKVVVVLNIGGVIETATWKVHPDAILLAWQGGQEGGHSVADILSGRVGPSGKLPMTFPNQLADHASHANFPPGGESFNPITFLLGQDDKPEAEMVRNKDFTVYEEGIYVGYRHFDRAGLEVSYPFGYGLSYTTFAYDDLQVALEGDSVGVELTVRNTGERPGKEVVQVYVGKPGSAVDRPQQELKAFAKTARLEPGEAASLRMRFPVDDLRYWDESEGAWTLEAGVYQVRCGSSSRDIRLDAKLELPGSTPG